MYKVELNQNQMDFVKQAVLKVSIPGELAPLAVTVMQALQNAEKVDANTEK